MNPTMRITLLLNWAFFPAVGVGQIQQPPVMRFTVKVDFGKDRGQSFGSLFEARDERGRVVAGAGFADVYNTRFRSDRHTLQFFVRPRKDADKFVVQRLPHPDLDCGVYLFGLNGQLFTWSSVRNNSVRRWDVGTKTWKNATPPKTGRIRSGDGVMRLGTGLLTFGNNRAVYNNRQILAPPKTGRYYNFYYAHGRLFFYHTDRSKPQGFTKVYACAWTPDDKTPIEPADAAILKTRYVGETPFAYGQFRGSVLTVSNQGGVYLFDGRRWKVLLEPDNRVSYQVYSIINYFDRLLLAQYPTGQLFEYNGNKLKLLKGWPPRLPGVSSSAREAQTLGIYHGDLFVGVWPWAELWRYDGDARKWHSMGRMFSHPKITGKTVHPYEADARKYGLVTNHWGQRITGMIPRHESLMLSTSSKGTYRWSSEYTFLTEKQRREYGAVLRLTMPGNLAAQIDWKNRPIEFDFRIYSDRLEIRQDGKLLASSRFKIGTAARYEKLTMNWGAGVFGRLNGTLIQKSPGR